MAKNFNIGIVILGAILIMAGLLIILYTETIKVADEIIVIGRPYWQMGVLLIVIGFVTVIIGAKMTTSDRDDDPELKRRNAPKWIKD